MRKKVFAVLMFTLAFIGNCGNSDASALDEQVTTITTKQGILPVPEDGGSRHDEPEDTKGAAESGVGGQKPVIPASPEQTSALENALSRDSRSFGEEFGREEIDKHLRQFGYDFFEKDHSVVSNAANLPVDKDYVLGPGDVVDVDIWGALNAGYSLTVSRAGEITIPKVGVVKLWGLSYAQGMEAVDNAIAQYYKNYHLNVTLGKLRTIQVFVVGEVNSPGSYAVSSLCTVINALSAAGGPRKTGSLRRVEVKREGALVKEVDLYDFFLTGDRSGDIRLMPGDTVFVPVIGDVAAVAGEVKKPAIYELNGRTSLADLLKMAGWLTALADPCMVKLERLETNKERISLDCGAEDIAAAKGRWSDVEVHDRDLVRVYPFYDAARKMVTLSGHVRYPGRYQFREGMKVSDLIDSLEKLLPDPYKETAEIIRLMPPDYHQEVINVKLEKALNKDAVEDIPLEENDVVKVFSLKDMEEMPVVYIFGEVLKPGKYRLYENMTVKDLLTEARLKRSAYLDEAELARVVVENGRAKTVHVTVNLEKAVKDDPGNNIPLAHSDALVVRLIPDWKKAEDRFVTLAGEVRYPGMYSISKGERLSSIIQRAGGFTDKAYLNASKFTRVSVREAQQKMMDEYIARLEKDIAQKKVELSAKASTKEEAETARMTLEGLGQTLEKLKDMKAEGRVVIRLTALEEFKDGPYDIELAGGDQLAVPENPGTVAVIGEVYNPTAMLSVPGRQVSYYLDKVGGATAFADGGEMYVVRADGSVLSNQQSSIWPRWDDDRKRWRSGGFTNYNMEPGDTVVVPRKLDTTAWLREIKDITTIVAQIALSAGIVVAAGL